MPPDHSKNGGRCSVSRGGDEAPPFIRFKQKQQVQL